MGTAFVLALMSLSACSAALPGDQPVEPGDQPPDQPIELGTVGWRHDHDAAFREAAASKRPVLLLFQEIPG